MALRNMKYRAQNRALGLCVRCGKPLAPDSRRECPRHKELSRAYWRARVRNKKPKPMRRPAAPPRAVPLPKTPLSAVVHVPPPGSYALAFLGAIWREGARAVR